MKYEIHTITFEKDIRLLELQLLSVDQLFDHSRLYKYRIVINDDNYQSLSEYLRVFIAKELSFSLQNKIEIKNSVNYISGIQDGWLAQQYLKLYSVADSNADWVMVLDSKNHFTQNTSIDDFFIGDLAKTVFANPSPLLRPWLDNSLAFFAVDNYSNDAMPTITPYLMKPSLTKMLLQRLQSDSRNDKKNIFDVPALKGCSEFFLYFAFLKKIGCINDFYVHSKKLCETLFTVWPQDSKITERFLIQILNGEYYLFGLHRKRLNQLSSKEKELIAQIWSSLRLPNDESYYLTCL